LGEVAESFDLGWRTVARFVQKQHTGRSFSSHPHAVGFPPALTAEAITMLHGKVIQAQTE
jgi:hypothetical protein